MRKITISIIPLIFFLLFVPGAALAADSINAGDTAWLLMSTALVMLMTPGLALFYGGMVRSKNVLGTMMHSFIAIAVVSVQWVLFGYSLAFGPDVSGVIGSLKWFALSGVGAEANADYAPTVPHLVFMLYQCMFAVITPALISGALAERVKFPAYVLFILLWSTFVYDPVAHWIWGAGGWLRAEGALDFAGGMVVHLSSGISALVAALLIGRRRGYLRETMAPHNLPMTVLGAGLLWFGWFGFNAGSALQSNGLAALAFVNTHTASVSAMLLWAVMEWRRSGKATIFGAATGAIAGLATITPAAGFVSPGASLLIGAAAGLLCYKALHMKARLGYDDSLDAFGVHGVGGVTGTLAAGLFASLAMNPGGANGLLLGNAHTFLTQGKAVLVVSIYSVAVTFVILKLIDRAVGLRVHDEHEALGLDLSQHSEGGYDIG